MGKNLKWYVIQMNTPSNFSSFQRLISSIIPKGCAVFSPSTTKQNSYWSSRLDRKMVVADYMFVLCDIKWHCPKIIRALRTQNIEASILKGFDGKPFVLSEEDIDRMVEIDKAFKSLEFQDSEFSLGNCISVVSGPMKGFSGNISLITSEYVYCPVKIINEIVNVPFLREDVVKIR